MPLTREEAEKVVDAILVDLQDRRGIGHEWFQCDGDVQEEIRNTWIDIAIEAAVSR